MSNQTTLLKYMQRWTFGLRTKIKYFAEGANIFAHDALIIAEHALIIAEHALIFAREAKFIAYQDGCFCMSRCRFFVTRYHIRQGQIFLLRTQDIFFCAHRINYFAYIGYFYCVHRYFFRTTIYFFVLRQAFYDIEPTFFVTGYLFLRTEILNFFVTVHLFLRTYDRILSYQDMGFVAVMMSLLRKTLTFLRTEMAIIAIKVKFFTQKVIDISQF